jgi:hypothetical protein
VVAPRWLFVTGTFGAKLAAGVTDTGITGAIIHLLAATRDNPKAMVPAPCILLIDSANC